MSEFRLMVRCPVCCMTARGHWTAEQWRAEPDVTRFLFGSMVNWQDVPKSGRQGRFRTVSPLEAVREVRALSPAHARQLASMVATHMRAMAQRARDAIAAFEAMAILLERETDT